MTLIDELWEIGVELIPKEFLSDLTIKGIWDTELYFQPHPNEIVFSCHYLIAQTYYQGCSFYNRGQLARDQIILCIGKDFIYGRNASLPIRIAVMDSIFAFGRDKVTPYQRLRYTGNPTDKAIWRAKIVSEEADKLLTGLKKYRSTNIALVGISGLILDSLTNLGHSVIPFDLSPTLVGHEIRPGLLVLNGLSVYSYIEMVDLVVVTGMALATNTLEEILSACTQNNKKVLVYAQTASNVAPWYLSYGVNTVVSEHIPFYNVEGTSEISIYIKT